jgi:hypothetical protein
MTPSLGIDYFSFVVRDNLGNEHALTATFTIDVAPRRLNIPTFTPGAISFKFQDDGSTIGWAIERAEIVGGPWSRIGELRSRGGRVYGNESSGRRRGSITLFSFQDTSPLPNGAYYRAVSVQATNPGP